MSTPPTSTSPPTTNDSFAERVNFATVYYGLKQHGIALTDEEKKKFETITREELLKNNGQLFGNDLGNSAVNLIYLLFAFIQNVFNGNLTNDLGNLGSNLSQIASQTNEQDKLNQLHQATMRIHQRLSAQGGNLAAAADLVTTKKPITTNDRSGPVEMKESIFHQLVAGIEIPAGTTTSLNERMKMSSLPPKQKSSDTQGLTHSR
jgi:hypothetical protein